MSEKSKTQKKPPSEKEAQKKPSIPPTWITPGSAEGDLETVEEDLKLQEEKKKGTKEAE